MRLKIQMLQEKKESPKTAKSFIKISNILLGSISILLKLDAVSIADFFPFKRM